jgi:shikimate kinase
MAHKRFKAKRIFLCGLSGSGKSTVGAILAGLLEVTFVDIDTEVEAATGMAISDMFAEKGEKEFRRLEREAIESSVENDSAVIALGGGAVENEQNLMMIKRSGLLVYLETSSKVAASRLGKAADRPLLAEFAEEAQLVDRLEEMRKRREMNYLTADIVIDTNGKSESDVAEEILTCIEAV